MSARFPEPWFVTPHAMRRYRERVDPHATDAGIIDAVQHGLQGAGPCYPPDRKIAIAERAKRPRFVAICAPPLPGHEWPSVVTVWGWGICPILLRRKRCAGIYRRYRWLNGAYSGVRA